MHIVDVFQNRRIKFEICRPQRHFELIGRGRTDDRRGYEWPRKRPGNRHLNRIKFVLFGDIKICLLYTSDAADE